MGMNVGAASATADPEVLAEINTTPLIDVMLVLLIMLIVTIPIQLHSVNLNLPNGNPPPVAAPPEVVRLDVAASGQALWNGQPVATQAELDALLAGTLQQAVPPEIHLRPDRAVPYRAVMAVMAAAQRLKVTRIGIVGSEQFL